MSRAASVDAKPSTAGIVQDALSQQRVIPESRRADGSVRKERKVRPGFTPVEDVARFRSSRQRQADEHRQQGAVSKPDTAPPLAAAAAAAAGTSSVPLEKPAPVQPEDASKPKQAPREKRSWAGSRLRMQTKLAPAQDAVPDTWDAADSTPASATKKDAPRPADPIAADKDTAEDLSRHLDSLRLTKPTSPLPPRTA